MNSLMKARITYYGASLAVVLLISAVVVQLIRLLILVRKLESFRGR